MKLAQTLIDNAVKMCESESDLARRLGMFPQDIHQLKTGKRVLSPEVATKLADIAGIDPRQAAIDALIERDLRNPAGGRVAEILGKALAAGVVATLVFVCSGLFSGATKSEAAQLTVRYIVCRWLRTLWAGHVSRMRVTWGFVTPIPPTPLAYGPR